MWYGKTLAGIKLVGYFDLFGKTNFGKSIRFPETVKFTLSTYVVGDELHKWVN